MSNSKELERKLLMNIIRESNPSAAIYLDELCQINHLAWENEMDREIEKEMDRENERKFLMNIIRSSNPDAAIYLDELCQTNHLAWKNEIDREIEKERERGMRKEIERPFLMMSIIRENNPSAAIYLDELCQTNHLEWENEMNREIEKDRERKDQGILDKIYKYNQNLSNNILTLDYITPTLGIGDLLLIKTAFINNNIHINQINLSIKLTNRYKLDPTNYINFITQLIPILFPKITINNFYSDIKIPHHPDVIMNSSLFYNKLYIYDDIIFEKNQVPYTNYLLFHTKIRFLNLSLSHDFIKNILPNLLNNFLTTFKTNKTIVLTGERCLEQNKEVVGTNTISIYSNLLLLKENNNVIDLTQDNLCSGGDIHSFLNDLELINKADCNIVFGLGGPFHICSAFSNNNICYFHDEIDDYNINKYISFKKFISQYDNENRSLHKNIYEFIDKINSKYSIL